VEPIHAMDSMFYNGFGGQALADPVGASERPSFAG
jgi:hypothetical protein